MIMDSNELFKSVSCRIKDDDEEIRHSAVQDLQNLSVPNAVPLLMGALADASYRIREDALEVVCAFPSHVIFPELEKLLRSEENALARNTAVEAFPRYGNDAVDYLTQLLTDPDNNVRMYSALMLGRIGDISPVDALIRTLDDPEPNVIHSAIEALGKIGDARAVAPLIGCLSRELWIQYPAIVALGDIGDARATGPLKQLMEENTLRQPTIEALGKIGDITIMPIFTDILRGEDTSEWNDVIASIVNIQTRVNEDIKLDKIPFPSIKIALDNERVIRHLLSALGEWDHKTKENAVTTLGWLKEKRAVEPLAGLISDYDFEEGVTTALVSIGREHQEELIRFLDMDDPELKLALIRCLGLIESDDSILACIPYLDDENSDVRQQAAIAMANGCHLEPIEDALLRAISDEDPEVVNSATRILGQCKSNTLVAKLLPELKGDDKTRKLAVIEIVGMLESEPSVPSLKELLSDKDDDIRAAVYRSLSFTCKDTGIEEILLSGLSDPSSTVKIASAECVFSADIGASAEGRLISLMDDPDPQVRIAAVEALGRIESKASIDRMIAIFDTSDHLIRMALVEAMLAIDSSESRNLLMTLLKSGDSDLKTKAITFFGNEGRTRWIPDIIKSLDDPHWSVRNAAVIALGRIGDKEDARHIVRMLSDKESLIRKSAIQALGELKATEAVPSLLQLLHDEHLQRDILSALEKTGIGDLDLLSKFLERSTTRLKCLFMDLLGKVGNPAAVDCLIATLEHDFYLVRSHAAKALGEIGDQKSITPLIKAKSDPCQEVSAEATLALNKMGHKE